MSRKDEDEAFEHEMSAHPWGYGQQRNQDFEFAMATIRLRGLWTEANVIMNEIQQLKAAVDAERDRCCKIVYGMAGSDNVAQRTVEAIRGK